ncbi:Transcriptional regulator, DeoR family [Candidatus Rhodobacter oscarellae]|uniref:Transcriptional regulator, DeoR family n=1 Tax=Candidatus Rhodobacter oscarellae TaxID=1675527 RepID=A0A0J9EB88_9RHOB|nr:YafY family protein [Candidatus Rhodobacter lobularis]KMW60045.1 Transcriptional regulator, DeoR family [Candidatus Rhodobacter lobularis]
MPRTNRLFEIIQILRARDRPVRADDLAVQMEVSVRTIYRDMAALQAMGTPIEGEAGIGYMMRRGYDLPPLNFDTEEIEALRVGLSMLARTGDSSLRKAAKRIREKVDALHGQADWLQVAPWGVPFDDAQLGGVPKADLRAAIREERKIRILYRSEDEAETRRTIRPIALVYHLEAAMLAAWCELRGGFRHFRTDRIYDWDFLQEDFRGQGHALRDLWKDKERWSADEPIQ